MSCALLEQCGISIFANQMPMFCSRPLQQSNACVTHGHLELIIFADPVVYEANKSVQLFMHFVDRVDDARSYFFGVAGSLAESVCSTRRIATRSAAGARTIFQWRTKYSHAWPNNVHVGLCAGHCLSFFLRSDF